MKNVFYLFIAITIYVNIVCQNIVCDVGLCVEKEVITGLSHLDPHGVNFTVQYLNAGTWRKFFVSCNGGCFFQAPC